MAPNMRATPREVSVHRRLGAVLVDLRAGAPMASCALIISSAQEPETGRATRDKKTVKAG